MSNDELQKAIDDITNGDNTVSDNATTDVADTGVASVSLPDDLVASSNVAANTNMNFMETPDANAGVSADIFGVPPTPDASMAMPTDLANPAAAAAPEMPADNNSVTDYSMPAAEPALASAPVDLSGAPAPTEVNVATPTAINVGGDLEAVKTAALIELYPLLPSMNVNPRQKYDICMTVIEKTGDKGATSVALDAAKMIPDAVEKGDCLMKLVEAINKL